MSSFNWAWINTRKKIIQAGKWPQSLNPLLRANREILNLVKKNITLEKAKAAVDLCNEAGIEPMTSYILGLPGNGVFRPELAWALPLATTWVVIFAGTTWRWGLRHYQGAGG